MQICLPCYMSGTADMVCTNCFNEEEELFEWDLNDTLLCECCLEEVMHSFDADKAM